MGVENMQVLNNRRIPAPLTGKQTFAYDFDNSLISCDDKFISNPRQLPEGQSKPRKIPLNPYRILDAPGLCDDFYLNLVDWSA